MTGQARPPRVVNGWTIYAHPLFVAQLEALARKVEAEKQKNPTEYVKKNVTKRLAAIKKMAFEVIPQDPTRLEYRQGNTLGDEYKHWFRAKFLQQYRLFFLYLTSTTGTLAPCTTFCATEPTSAPARAPRPWLPMTISSTAFSAA